MLVITCKEHIDPEECACAVYEDCKDCMEHEDEEGILCMWRYDVGSKKHICSADLTDRGGMTEAQLLEWRMERHRAKLGK